MSRNECKQTIRLIQLLKQADEPPVHRLCITNTRFHVPGELDITPKSKITFSFYAHLRDNEDLTPPSDMEAMGWPASQSDSEDDDLAILLGRKRRKNAGDTACLPAAHLPHYPEVRPNHLKVEADDST
jgi:hypothetical protein